MGGCFPCMCKDESPLWRAGEEGVGERFFSFHFHICKMRQNVLPPPQEKHVLEYFNASGRKEKQSSLCAAI